MSDVCGDYGGERRDVVRRSGRGEMGLVDGAGPVVMIVGGVGVGKAGSRFVIVAGVEDFIRVRVGDVEPPAMPAGVVEHGRVVVTRQVAYTHILAPGRLCKLRLHAYTQTV